MSTSRTPDGLDLEQMALRIAASSVEAARKRMRGRKRSRKVRRDPDPEPRSRGVRTSRPARQERDVLRPLTEYACQAEIAISVDFEGSIGKAALLKKLKDEIGKALRAAVSITAKDTGLEPSNVKVQPIKFDCAVNDGVMPDEI